MLITIYSFRGVKSYENAEGVMIKTPTGEITVLNHHRPLITPIVAGQITVLKSNEERESVTVRGGVLEVRPASNVTILADE